jgi:hypothetical protein
MFLLCASAEGSLPKVRCKLAWTSKTWHGVFRFYLDIQINAIIAFKAMHVNLNCTESQFEAPTTYTDR